MSKITLDEKNIFNEGLAGVVSNCSVKFEKRKDTEPKNLPIYKLIAIDSNGAEVNKGFFYNDKFDSEAKERFFKNEMRHLLKIFKVENPKNEFDSFPEMLDYVINECRKNSEGAKFNVVVDYGTDKWPKRFLQMNGYPWYIMPNDSPASLRNDALQIRPIPDSETKTEDLATTSSDKDSVDDWIS